MEAARKIMEVSARAGNFAWRIRGRITWLKVFMGLSK
jgi:hypothetical protein